VFHHSSEHIGTNLIFFLETAPSPALSVAINIILKIEGITEKLTQHRVIFAKFCPFFTDMYKSLTKKSYLLFQTQGEKTIRTFPSIPNPLPSIPNPFPSIPNPFRAIRIHYRPFRAIPVHSHPFRAIRMAWNEFFPPCIYVSIIFEMPLSKRKACILFKLTFNFQAKR